MSDLETEKALEELTFDDVRKMSEAEVIAHSVRYFQTMEQHRQENALLYYKPASPGALKVHYSRSRTTFVGGGNGSSKTETCLVEMLIHATGVVPFALRDIGIDWSSKLRGPIQCRIGLESLVMTMHRVMLPKMRWRHWTGMDEPGGERGHWGWVPKSCLIDGDWDKSWSEKTRTLRVLYRDPNQFERVLGESTIQIASHDQSPEDMASGDLHMILLDEPPPYPIWTESQVRTARVNGRILLAMTWPDDPSINVDWIFDEIYEPGQPGPNKDPNIELHRLVATDNRTIDTTALLETYRGFDDRKMAVRVEGKPIRFSNRVHELFTDSTEYFCFSCGCPRMVQEDGRRCSKCGGTRTVGYCHVAPFEHDPQWPVVSVMDPHPRKDHMGIYVAVDPMDHYWQVAEFSVPGGPMEVREACDQLERSHRLRVVARLIDPKMAANPSGAQRGRTWWDEFADVDLICDPADASDTGRQRVDDWLRPDQDELRPRMTIHPRCPGTIHQMKRFMWDDWKIAHDRAQKQKTKEKYDDFPDCWRYFGNFAPRWQMLTRGGRVIRALGGRR